MFSITDNERLRDAYALLMFMQRDISASAEKKAAVKNLAATVKMEIRAYNNRPVSSVRIISADYDGRLELVKLPDKLDEKAIEKMLYDQQQGWPLCPRCGERMPDKLTHGALSRHAKGVYICEACGTDEALRDWTGNVKPLSDWVLVRVYNGDLRR